MEPKRDIQPESRKRDEHLSNDGKWRSFPKVPHLLQYVSNGNYYGRIKIGGKTIRESLETTVWTTAKIRLTDFLKEHQEVRQEVTSPTFAEAVALFKQELENDATIKPKSKEYRLLCLHKIETTWTELWSLHLNEIAEESCKEWAGSLSGKIACHYYNNTIATLRQVLDAGIRAHKAKNGIALEKPAKDLKRVRVKQKDLQLPESAQFTALVENIRQSPSGWGRACG